MFETLFTPAGWAFSIWSLIYGGLACFTVYQFLPSQADDRVAQQVAGLFIASCMLNLGWLFAWHFLFTGLSFVFMAALVITVAEIYRRVTNRRSKRTAAYRLLVALPFRIYLGWLLVAAMANLMAMLQARGYDWLPLDQFGFALILLGVTVLLGVLALLLRHDLFLNLALVWGLVAVAFGPASTTLMLSASLAAAAILLGACAWQVVRQRNARSAAVNGGLGAG